MGGLPQYVIDEIEDTQARSLRILDVPNDTVMIPSSLESTKNL